MFDKLNLSVFKKIYDESPVAFAVLRILKDENGAPNDFFYEYANKTMADFDGLTVKDIEKKKYSVIYNRYPPAITLKNLAETAKNRTAGSTQEYWREIGLSISMQYAYVAEDCVSVSVINLSEIEHFKKQNEQFVNRIPGGVVIIEVTDEWKIFHCNDWYRTTLGYTTEEMEKIQTEKNAGIHPDDIDILKNCIRECFKDKDSDMVTFRVRQKNGVYKYLSLNVMVVGRTNKKLTIYGLFNDVDKYVRLSNKLAYVNAEMDNMIASIPGGISKYVLNTDGTLQRLYSSPGMAELVGKTPEEYEKDFDRDWKENIYYADFPIVQKKIVECIRTLKSTEFTYRLIHKDGSLVWVTALVRVIGEKDGRPLAHAVFHAMTKSEVLYQALLDNIDTVTIVRDIANGEILYVNKATTKFLDFDEKFLIGKNYYEIMKEKNLSYEEFEVNPELNESKEVIAGAKCYSVTSEKLVWNDRESVATFLTDVTDSWIARQKIQDDKDKLDEIVNKIPLGIVVFKLDEDDTILIEHLNDNICELANIDKEKIVIGDPEADFSLPFDFYKSDIPAILNAFEMAKTQTEPVDFNFRIVNDNGEITWFKTTFQSVKQDDGSFRVYAGFIDITPQKDLEEQLLLNAKELKESVANLQESKERLSAVSERAELFYWEIELETGNVSANFASEDSPSRNFNNDGFATDFVIQEDLGYFTLMTGLAVSGKEKHVSFDIRVGENVNTSEWYRVTYDVIRDDENKPVSLLGLAQNINELKLEQRRLDEEVQSLESATQKQDVLSTMRVNLTDNVIESYNSKPETQLDVKTGDKYTDVLELIASHAASKTDKEEVLKHQSREKLLSSFENGEKTVSIDYQVEIYDSASYWINSTIRLYKNPVTKKVMCFMYCYDINEIHVTKEIINKVVESGYDNICVINTKSRKVELSIGEEKALNYMKNGDVYDRSLMNAFSKIGFDDMLESNFDNCCLSNVMEELSEKAEYAYPFNFNVNQRKGRKLFTYSWFDEEKTKILLLITDITDIYQQEVKRSEELAKALEAAVLANKSKTDFLSRMSHEIRTPMNAILGMSRLGEELSTEENVSTYFKDINASGNYLLGLINDILDMSRIEQGKMEIYNKYEQKEEVIRSVEVVVRPLAEAKKVDFEIISNDNTAPWVYVDLLRTQQVYINILNNAVKFTEPGGKVTWEIDGEMLTRNTCKIVSKITDSGCGMSKNFLEHIFEPFAQEQNSLVNARQGTGLGLAIAKSIVEKMGGSINVESTIGIGTTFTIEFVRNCKEEAVAENSVQKANDVKNLLEGKKVLLCEDHPLNTLVATRLLEKAGMVVETAENGMLGVEKFAASEENEFAVVLMDIRMPVMDGLEATSKIRALNRQDAKSVPIIAMTANAFAEDKVLSRAAGMNEHLSKPIEPQVLYKTLSDYIK